MTKEQLERANFLNHRINKIDEALIAYQKNICMTIVSYPNNNWDKEQSISIVERKHQQEILALLKKWRDEYQKELERL